MKITKKGCKNPAAVAAAGCCPSATKLKSAGAPAARKVVQQTAKKG